MDQTVQLSELANGRLVELRVGQSVEISLPENRTTGFRWHLRADGAPACPLSQESFVPAASQPGSAGTRNWRFQAAQPGDTTIELRYSRPWEEPKAAAKTFTVAVRVTDNA